MHSLRSATPKRKRPTNAQPIEHDGAPLVALAGPDARGLSIRGDLPTVIDLALVRALKGGAR